MTALLKVCYLKIIIDVIYASQINIRNKYNTIQIVGAYNSFKSSEVSLFLSMKEIIKNAVIKHRRYFVNNEGGGYCNA